jgi:Ca-activated chloride channel family protein
MRFENPWFLLLLAVPAVAAYFRYFSRDASRTKLTPTILFSSGALFPGKHTFLSKYSGLISDALLAAALVFMIIALARPLGGAAIQTREQYGVDIVLAIDTSGSMLNVDRWPPSIRPRQTMEGVLYFDPTGQLPKYSRVATAKRVIDAYIDKQANNRIGLVVFAGYSYTKCPLTLDKTMLHQVVSAIEYNPDNDMTAIGMGIMTSINRLKQSHAKSRVIILLTDGMNNTGLVAPMSAAQVAARLGIRIYTIGLGNPDECLTPRSLEQKEYIMTRGEGIDENILSSIADLTGGKYYRAYEPQSLGKIYDDIDRLEKSRIEVKERVRYQENFLPFLFAGLLFLAAWTAFRSAVIRLP